VSDDPGIQSESTTPSASPPQPKTGISGFLSTTVGKVVIGCLGGAILLGIVAVIVFIALGSFGVSLLGGAANQTSSGQGTLVVTTSTVAPGAGGSKSASGTVAPSVTATPSVLSVTDDDVFTPRDPFIPVVLPSPAPTSTASSGGTEGGSSTSVDSITPITTADSNILYLRALLTTSSGDVAVLDWKGKIYQLHEGEAIPDSPWKVLTIDASAGKLTMLFGDERVSITVNGGVQSK
jgi:hypothetical protein